jgi:hypothetical protein
VIRWLQLAIVAGFLLALASSPLYCHDGQDGCAELQEQWGAALQTLKERMEELRRFKSAPLEPAIQREQANQGNALSIAGSVRAALEERAALTDAATRQCRDAADQERIAFEELRTCLPSGRQRRSNTNASWQNGDLDERKLVLAALQELLLDEAYLQYKNYRAPSPPTYSDYGPQWGPGPGSAYDPYRANRGYR